MEQSNTFTVWTNFLNKHKIKVDLKNNLTANNQSKQKEYVGYWFFQQRTDKRSIHIQFGETKIEYCANRLLILDSEQTFSVINKGAKLPNTLNCIVYFNLINKIRLKNSYLFKNTTAVPSANSSGVNC
jgi:hypothetical protein